MAYHRMQDTSNGLLAGKNKFSKITPKQWPGKASTTPYIKIEKAEGEQIILRVAIEISENLHFLETGLY